MVLMILRSPCRPCRLGLMSVVLAVLVGCQTAYYATMEKLGYHKRDILVSRVQEARDSQHEAKEQFASALEQFSSVLNFKGGKLVLQRDFNMLS